ncbi:gmeb-2, partial [Pristionchus pacificus]
YSNPRAAMVDSGLPLVVTPDPSSASPSSTGSLTTVACLGGGPTTTITISRSASPSSSQDDSPLLLLTTVDEASIDARAAQQASLGPIIGVPNGPKIIEVKCGPLHAKMHVEHFLCPGIHQPCIELDGEMISPKEFTVRANKDKQKDWKGSIRIGKSNLRSLMEMRSFDFYNHSLFCSAKCQSRNYITPKSALLHSSSEKGSASSSSSTTSESDKDSRRSSKSSIEQLLAMQLAAGAQQPQAAAAAASAAAAAAAAGVKTQYGYGYQPQDHC